MKIKMLWLVGAVVLFFVTPLYAGNYTLNFDETGYFDYDVAGMGLHVKDATGYYGTNMTSGTLNMNIPGNPVYGITYWHGFSATGNAGVNFNGNSITGTALSEAAGGESGVGFWAGVTPYLNSGSYSYTIDNVAFGSSPGATDGVHNGFGITAVSEDASQTNYGRMIIATANDFAYFGSTGNNGPNSLVWSFNVDPVDFNRNVQLSLVFAGGEDESRGWDRQAYLWHYTSTDGSFPANLVGAGTRYPENYMMFARQGFDWDIYNLTLPLPANSSLLALQMQSDPTSGFVNGKPRVGESFSWVSTNIFIPEVIPEPATLVLLGTGAAIILAFRRKKGSASN